MRRFQALSLAAMVSLLPTAAWAQDTAEGALASARAGAGVLHPSAAVCGTPTALAASVLAELEGFDRGRYAGPVGWLDASGDGEFAIALRCGQVSPEGTGIRLFAGGGIVAGSDQLLHANGFHMATAIEPLGAAIARIAAGGVPVTSVRRLAGYSHR